ncbi:MAG: IS21 family transposase, partial [Terriglobia bacterium]
ARHERCFNRQQKVLNLEHYLEALSKKPGAFAGSTPLEQWRAQGRWPASFDRFWEMLKQRRGQQPGTRAMIEVLLLGRQYGYPRLQAVIEKALDMSCFDVEAVRLLLDAERNGKREPCEAVEVGALRVYDRPQPTTRNYDQLLENYSGGEVIQ